MSKRGNSLSPRDLKIFSHSFIKDLSRFLPDYDFKVGSAPESEAYRIEPLFYRRRPLGYISIKLQTDKPAAPDAVWTLWPEILAQSLEKIILRKSLITDSESNLYNLNYFMTRLNRRISRLDENPRAPRLKEAEDTLELILAVAETHNSPKTNTNEIKLLANVFSNLTGGKCLARIDSGKIGFIILASPKEARTRLEKAKNELLNKDIQTIIAYARYPHDLSQASKEIRQNTPKKADLLLEKALATLFFAKSRPLPSVTGFEDLIINCGQITQVLPLDRVVINLGSSLGAKNGQVFTVTEDSDQPKGEITIFETSENYSLAQIAISQKNRHLNAGDRLIYSRQEWKGQDTNGAATDDLAPFDQEIFKHNLTRLILPEKPLALALIRIDDFEKLDAMLGGPEVEKQLEKLRQSLAENFPLTPEICTRWSPGILAVVWPGAEASAILGPAETFIHNLGKQFSASMGLVFWPSSVLQPSNLITSALKTLKEASMTGSGQIIVFGPQTLNISGDDLFNEGDLDGALEEYRKGLMLDPGHINLLNSLGVCYGRKGDFQGAQAAFSDVLNLDSDNLMAHFNKGCSFLLNGQPEEAFELLSRAAELNPLNFEVLYQLGKTALELGHNDKALTSLSQAAELKDKRGVVFRLLGQARLLAGDTIGAMTAFKKAVKFNPDDAQSLSSLGTLFLQANDLEVAKSLFLRSVELDPTNSLYRQRLGRLLFDLGDFANAEHHLQSALHYGSHSPEIQYQLGRLTEELGRPPKEAIEYYQETLKRDPGHTQAKESLNVHLNEAENTAKETNYLENI